MIQSSGQVESLTDEVIEVVKQFIQTIIYNGSLNKSFVESRVRLCKNLKKKTSAAIPADPDSTLQEIKRVHLQSFICLRCIDPIIPILDVRQFGWTVSNENRVKPVWFVGHQLPPSLRRSCQKRKGTSGRPLRNASDADEESCSTDNCRLQNQKKRKRDPVNINENLSDADNEFENVESVEEFMETVNTALENSSSEFENDISTSDSNVTSDSDYIV